MNIEKPIPKNNTKAFINSNNIIQKIKSVSEEKKYFENQIEIRFSDFFNINSMSWVKEFNRGAENIDLLYWEKIEIDKLEHNGSRLCICYSN